MQTLDWENLPFGYIKTNQNVRSYFRNGAWTAPEATSSETIDLHMAATCLHYGQEAFEGLKAFLGKDNKVRVFRWQENAKRMQNTAKYILMAEPTNDVFFNTMKICINANKEFIPPYGTGASLYIRPLLIGSGPQVGVKPAQEYLFMIFVSPVGPYFKEGFTPINIQLIHDFDRAAQHGTGHVKVGGNYAAGLLAQERAHAEGFSTVLYLDSKENKYIDECGPANFFAIKNNTYITPDSQSILPSITNQSLIELAKHLGLKVERRKIPVEELSSFEEVGTCGTAAVITPINKIVDRDSGKVLEFCKDNKAGPVSTKLYNLLKGIQIGDEPDPFGWVTIID